MVVLFVGAKLIDGRGAMLTGELALLWGPLRAFFVGLFIIVLLLGAAGPTGELSAKYSFVRTLDPQIPYHIGAPESCENE